MKTEDTDMRPLLRMSEAARLLGITVHTLRAWDKKGWIKTVRSPGRTRLVPTSEVERIQSGEGIKE